MNATLYKQIPKPDKVGFTGYINSDDKTAHFFAVDGLLVTTLEKPEIKFISADGIMLRGFQPNGFTAQGVQKLVYQEWLLRL